MMVTLDGSSGDTNAYVSVLSATGSSVMSGASLWLDAGAASMAEVASRPPSAKAPAAVMMFRRFKIAAPFKGLIALQGRQT
jgi:hypothetical protein